MFLKLLSSIKKSESSSFVNKILNNPLALNSQITIIHNKTHILSALSLVPALSPGGDWGPSRCVQSSARASSVLSTATVTASGRNYEQIKKEILPMMGMGYTRKNSRKLHLFYCTYSCFPLQRKFKLVQNNDAIVKGFTFKK